MNICLFTEEEITSPLAYADERAQHIIKILHKKEGDFFSAGIIGGQSGRAQISRLDAGEKKLYFSFTPEGDGKPLNNLKMIIGFPRPIQLKRLLRDIAALGVCEVHLTGTELGEKSYMKSTLVEKGSAYKMLLDGSVQAGSTHIPGLFMHVNLQDCLAQEGLNHSSSKETKLVCLDNVNPSTSLSALDFKGCRAVAAIGSERGWTDRERLMLEKAGYVRCGMGCRIMRTETAATAAGAIILNSMGVMK